MILQQWRDGRETLEIAVVSADRNCVIGLQGDSGSLLINEVGVDLSGVGMVVGKNIRIDIVTVYPCINYYRIG